MRRFLALIVTDRQAAVNECYGQCKEGLGRTGIKVGTIPILALPQHQLPPKRVKYCLQVLAVGPTYWREVGSRPILAG